MELLNKLDVSEGLGVGVTKGSSSDLFFVLHTLSGFVVQKKKVLFVSARIETLNIRMMCSKLALRYDPLLVDVVVPSVIKDVDLSCSSSLEDIASIHFPDYSFVIFEDVSVFSRFGMSDSMVLDTVMSLRRQMPEQSLLYISSSVANKLTNMVALRADFQMSLELIGDGFSKNVTGKLQIRSRSGNVAMVEQDYLYLTGERTMKCFYPGSVPFITGQLVADLVVS